MTSPTIFQTPGAIDDASAAFMKAFVTSRQLASQRQQLQIEMAKAQSQIGLEGAQAGEAKARTAQLEQQLEDTRNNEAGARYAAAHVSDPGDIGAFAQTLGNIPDEQRQYALAHWLDFREAGAKARKAQSDADQAALDYQNAQRDQRNQAAFQQTIEHYKTLPLTLQNVQLMGRDLAMFDATKAEATVRPLLGSLEGDWRSVVGNDGKWFLYDGKRGSLRDTGVNLGPKGANATQQVAMQIAAEQIYHALSDAIRLERLDANASKKPTGAALAKGIGGVGIPGVGHPLAGAAEPAAVAAMTSNQLQFQNDIDVVVSQYPNLMKSFRGGEALLQRLETQWRPKAGADDGARAQALRNHLFLLRQVDAIRQGKQMDLMQLPGYKESVIGAAQEQPAPATQASGDYREQAP